jgi:hypothetical protein
MADIGILHGNLESFPQAVLEELNGYRRGCCRYLTIDALNLDDPIASGWNTSVVLDLFSRRLPFLNESLYLIWQFSETKVLNEPRTLRLHNRATVRKLASLAGYRTAKAYLFPAKETFPKLPEEGFSNLQYPICWEKALATCGPYPLLQSLRFNGEAGGLITDQGTLWRRYNETGSGLQELVSPPSSEHIFRVFFVGDVMLVREMDLLTRQLYPSRKLPKSVTDPLAQAAKRIRKEVHLSISSFDLGWDGKTVEYIDLNPDPALEWWHLGEEDFSRLVAGAVSLLKNYIPAPLPKRSSAPKLSKKKGKR